MSEEQATIVIPKVRQGSDVRMTLTLTDNGVAVDWTSLSDIVAMLYSNEQRVLTGRCTTAIDPEDATKLVCDYDADQPEFLGLTSIVIRCTYLERTKTFDKKVLEFVASTEDLDGEDITLEDPELDVTINVEDVSTSLLDNAIAAAFDGGDFAMEKGQYAKDQGDYAKDKGDYAKDQGDYAKDQGDYAKDQGDYAKNKGDYAKQKGDYALEQGGVAADAAALAVEKAGLANDAATLANTKAGLADDAATLANTKAGLADDAATLANTKAGLANDAATLANQKAGYASDQGDYAKAQGDYAKEKGDAFAALIVDNLTTNDPAKALSAKQGKVLNDNLSQLGQEVLNNYFIGAGATASPKTIVGLKPGNKYRIYIKNPNWDMEGVPIEHNYKFYILSYQGTTKTTIVGVYVDSEVPVSDFYDVTIPTESDYIIIGGRAASSVKVEFSIVDITYDETKLDTSDIVDDLTSSLSDKPLSANQGKVLDGKISQSVTKTSKLDSKVNIITGIEKIIKNNAYIDRYLSYIDDPDWYVSQLLPVQTDDKIIITTPSDIRTSSAQKGCVFDQYLNLLGFFSIGNRSTTITVEDAAFVAMSVRKSDAEYFSLSSNGRIIYGYGSPFVLSNPLEEVINKAKGSLITACRYGYGNTVADETNNRKDGQMLIMTDTHTFTDQIQDHIDTCKEIESIDGMLLCGDYTYSNYNPEQAQKFIEQIKGIHKPIALCLGNHDVGYRYYCGNSANHQQAYDTFIAPLVAAGKITQYTPGVPYYYIDDASHNIRYICVYEYDGDLAIDETHWELVAYDASKPMISTTATYYQGDIVNVPRYTTGSFMAKETIDMTGASAANKNKYPSYIVKRDDRVIRETQANWLASTLLSTPEGYKVVILTHQHFSSKSSTQPSLKFCINQNYTSGVVSEAMQTDLIADMVDAFMNKSNFVERVVMKGDASYMNTIPDGEGGYYSYEVEADFSNLGNVGFLCYVNGHHHRDMIWRHNTYPRQWGVTSSQTGYYYEYDADIRRSRNDATARNTMTVISFDNDHDTIRLVKVGNQHTVDGRLRDFEVIELNPQIADL